MLAVWAAAVLVVGAALMVPHVIALPAPATKDGRLALAMRDLAGTTPRRWTALHVLYQDCGCSARVFAHLTARHARADLNEEVLFVRDAPQSTTPTSSEGRGSRARSAGFGFEERHAKAELQATLSDRIGAVAGGRGSRDRARIRHSSGGYTERSGAVEVKDTSIIDGVQAGRTVEPLPVFGCAGQ